MGMMEFKNDQGQVIKLDSSLNLAQLTARGISIHFRPKEEPPIPGAFYPTDDALDNLLAKKNLIPEKTGIVVAANPPPAQAHQELCHCVKPRPPKGPGHGSAICQKCHGVISWLAQA